jgi:NADP-dependent 3-hydroxy acid dehydrogenase YdfG
MLADDVSDVNQENGEAHSLVLNVTNQTKVNEKVKQTIERFGKIDILVNNAGGTRPTRVRDIDEKEWDFIFDVNMKGTFFMMQAVLPHMKENNYGRIVNLSSVSGKRGGGIFGDPTIQLQKQQYLVFQKQLHV